jgi:hypothetical protein
VAPPDGLAPGVAGADGTAEADGTGGVDATAEAAGWDDALDAGVGPPEVAGVEDPGVAQPAARTAVRNAARAGIASWVPGVASRFMDR